MKRSLPAVLLLYACLPTPRANGQVRPPVVQLDSGLTLRRPLVGLDLAYYQRLRRAYAADTLLLGVRQRRIAALERGQQLADSALAQRARQVGECQAALSQQQQDFARLQAQTQSALARPPARPLLLSGHTYLGATLGALAGLLLGLGLK